MSKTDHPFEEFPESVRQPLESVWNLLGAEQQGHVQDLVRTIQPEKFTGIKALMSLGREHLDMTFGNRSRVAIVGPANAGKSTLFNQLIKDSQDRSIVSPVPGTTRQARTADASLFGVVDTPGADLVGTAGLSEKEIALEAARLSDFLLIVFDAVQGIRQSDLALFKELQSVGAPYIVLLNKIDQIPTRSRKELIARSADALGITPESLISVSAKKAQHLERVLIAILKAEPALLVALGQALPAYRQRIAWQAILRSATTSAAVALTPIPIVDFLPLVAVQGLLVLSIARIYNYKMTLKRARELAGTLGAGYLGRSLFYELTKLGGPPTWIISVAIATSTTIVVGQASILWFAKGEKLTKEASGQMMRSLTQNYVEKLKGESKRRPGRRRLAKMLGKVLPDDPNAEYK
ncbi:MAG: GTPase [Anaerolineae bacterium]